MMIVEPELSCRELVELVTEYLEGTLARRERVRFESHLAGCEGCTAYIEQMRAGIAAAGTLTEDDLDPAAREALLAVFRDWRRNR